MKMLFFVTGILGLSLTAIAASAQDITAGSVAFNYEQQPAASVASETKAQEQTITYYAVATPESTESKPTAMEATAAKSMSEELSAWVVNKQAVINSYKRPKRRNAPSPVW